MRNKLNTRALLILVAAFTILAACRAEAPADALPGEGGRTEAYTDKKLIGKDIKTVLEELKLPDENALQSRKGYVVIDETETAMGCEFEVALALNRDLISYGGLSYSVYVSDDFDKAESVLYKMYGLLVEKYGEPDTYPSSSVNIMSVDSPISNITDGTPPGSLWDYWVLDTENDFGVQLKITAVNESTVYIDLSYYRSGMGVFKHDLNVKAD